MARSFQTAKLISSFFMDGASTSIPRRGFSATAAAQGAPVSSSVRTGAVLKKATREETVIKSAEKVSSWGPDPKTGYYRPESAATEIDVAELRAALLKHDH
ncbi:hypothetical protein SAY86_024352 [Trapa natans]|uniref:Uncharacterized protein n=1 Tax=Trapa natans TaxID=22666 RepID=A0AAN7M6I2_TRANT|nr:hypothetical protein SAY86_024352 [Trapa natans]